MAAWWFRLILDGGMGTNASGVPSLILLIFPLGMTTSPECTNHAPCCSSGCWSGIGTGRYFGDGGEMRFRICPFQKDSVLKIGSASDYVLFRKIPFSKMVVLPNIA
jgi:hypothetical protein